jgi:hypothetical protein
MKNIKYIWFLLILLAFGWACTEEDNLEPIGNWELTEPSISAPAATDLTLNEDVPNAPLRFEWTEAESSNRYQVRYALVVDSASNADFSTPILSITSGNGGRNLFVETTHQKLDQALSVAGYDAGATIDLKYAVIATSLDKKTMAAKAIKIKRFLTEAAPLQLFISGTATEKGADLSQAIPMKAFKDADGNLTGEFEIYTSLEAGKTFRFYSRNDNQALVYGLKDGLLKKNGEPFSVPESGPFRIKVNFNNNTMEMLTINKWSIVGNVIAGGWGGDEALQYKGNSVWQGTVTLAAQDDESSRFIFRANGDWGYLLKRIKGTENELYMESQAGNAGIQIEDIPVNELGLNIITLNLAADKYSYTIEKDNSITPPTSVPDKLYLLANGAPLVEFNKEGNIFKSVKYLALQAGVEYKLNSASDGSGTNYAIPVQMGESNNPDGDAVSANLAFGEGGAAITVTKDQAYSINLNFGTGILSWKYYNLKLFHWSDWDSRDEFLMTYVHPHKFEVTAPLKSGFEMKFNSPWDVEMGADDASALSGTMTNKGGANFKSITQDGNYLAKIEVTDTYATGTYEFIKQ